MDGRRRSAVDAARRDAVAPARRPSSPGALAVTRRPSPPTPPRARRPASSSLTRGTDVRRIPFWFRVEAPQLGNDPHTTLAQRRRLPRQHRRQGVARLDATAIRSADSAGVPIDLSGPEQVFRFDADAAGRELRRRRARPRRRASGSRRGSSTPATRTASSATPGLPRRRSTRTSARPVAVARRRRDPARRRARTTSSSTRRPARTPGRSRSASGSTTRRRRASGCCTRTVARGDAAPLAVTDAGSGVDPRSLDASGSTARRRAFTFAHGVASIALDSADAAARTGSCVAASDYQESKNMENVGPILPNTRTLTTTVVVR